ncbi:ATP-binding protein [Aquabacterium humicola]|uniref:ATP-binding protein n=1 Tax=Aquabacterium humicola TaxID=3237377 RepID=UPI0025431B08|nr:ATP-binding protein [Rubrivivax pictus]
MAWPRTLRGRVALVLVTGLLAAYGLSGWLVMREAAIRLDADARWRWLLQALVIGAAVAVAARLVTRPLATLADAARRLGDDPAAPPLPETGPSELRAAATAFNTMQQRLAEQTAERIAERVQILAAISHDLQTPITRMRLRCEQLADEPLRDRLQADLDQMQRLVEAGLAYARSAHAATEVLQPVDIAGLLDALACERADAGQAIAWQPPDEALVWPTRPLALKRIVDNLLDNALKFGGGDAELALEPSADEVVIAVRDRGPGIPEAQLADVLRPFVRIDASRDPARGGSGLGLAIVQRLADALGARLVLRKREGGGLEAILTLRRQTSSA